MPPPLDAAAPAARPRILLIDDDAISREVLCMLLEMHGFSIACAEDGAQALESAVAVEPDVILLDTQMPGLSGLDLIRALRTRTEARIVAISGSEPGQAIRRATDGFLLKPIQPEDLDALLADALLADALLTADPSRPPSPDPSESPATQPAIDPQVLGKLRAMMPPAAVREIYTAVAADLRTRLEALAAAIEAGDAGEVARIAHTTKGGCSMVGLTAAAQAAARLESSNLNGTWPKELLQLRGALAALESILGDEFPT